MKASKTIMAATDFSVLADVGVEVAFKLARRIGGRVHLVHVLEKIAPSHPASSEDERQRKASAKLEAIHEKDLTVTREVCHGIPSRELVKAAETAEADLVIVATHGHKGLGRVLIGSVAASIIRTSHVPILVVGASRRNLDFRTVVAGVDLSPVSREVLEAACTYATPGARIEAVSFYEPPVVMADDVLPYYPTPAELVQIREEREKAIRDLVQDIGGAEVHVAAIAEARASSGILDKAEELKADLVVVGTSGHNAWHRAFIGSTATRVLSEATCPVLVVPVKQ